MKKILSIFLGMLLVLGFAASAFAIHMDIPSDDSTPAVASGTTSITLSGEERVRYRFYDVTFSNLKPMAAFFDQRTRLGFEAKMSPNTTGFIQLESDTGNAAAPDSVTWGSPNALVPLDTAIPVNGTNVVTQAPVQNFRTMSKGWPATVQVGNNLKPGLSLFNAWILHQGTGLLGVNSGFKIGHQPIILPGGMFLDHSMYGDDGIIAFVNPVKELELDAVYLKLRQQSTTLSDSTNGYAFIAQWKPNKDTALAFDATYLDVQNLGETASSTALYPNVHLWNFGLNAKTAISGISFMFDGNMQTGTEDQISNTTPNLKFSGVGLKAGVGYTLAPVKLTLDAGYGSGDNGMTANKNKTFITFVSPTGNVSPGLATFVYNYLTVNAAGVQYGGLENTMYIRLDGNADVTKDLNVDLSVWQLAAVHAIKAGNYTFANAALNIPHSNNIGTEIDTLITYKIDKGLKYYVEGGYLFAGNFWENLTPVVNGIAQSPKGSYGIQQGIQLNF